LSRRRYGATARSPKEEISPMSETAAASASATGIVPGPTVPVTAMSKLAPNQANAFTALVIGKNRPNYYNLNPDPNASFWWLVVVDLNNNLNVVANVLGDGKTVPSAVQPFVGDPQYFLFCLGNCLQGWQIPFSDFYTFLQQVGSGPQLARLEQVYHQLSSGILQNYSYILAATMDTSGYSGYEALSFTSAAVLAMQFMPVTIAGQTIYSPIDPFSK
jgi:hypothetical protein